MTRPTPARPLVGDSLAMLILGFCAVTPFKGSPLLTPLLLLAVLLHVVHNRGQLGRVWVSLALTPYLAWLAFSLLWSVEPSESLKDIVIILTYSLFGVLIAVNRGLRELMRLLLRAAVVLLVLSWIVYFALPGVGRMQDTAYVGAMRGIFSEKNGLGYFSVVTFLTGVAWAVDPSNRRLSLWRRWGPAALALATVFGSTSKTALSVCLAAVAIMIGLRALVQGRRPLGLATVGLLGLVALVAELVRANWGLLLGMLGRDATLTGRTQIWQIVIQAISERPVLGYGWKALWVPDSPTTMKLWARNAGTPFFHAHNGYLDLASQLGLVGLFLALVVLGTILVRSLKKYLAHPTPIAGWPVILVLVCLVYNATEVVAFTNTTWIVLVALASMLHPKGTTCTSVTPIA